MPGNSNRLRDVEKRLRELEKSLNNTKNEVKAVNTVELKDQIKTLFSSLESRADKHDLKKIHPLIEGCNSKVEALSRDLEIMRIQGTGGSASSKGKSGGAQPSSEEMSNVLSQVK